MKSSFLLKLNFGTLPFFIADKDYGVPDEECQFSDEKFIPSKIEFYTSFFIADKECGVPDKEYQVSDEKFISSKIEFWHTPLE